MKKFITLVAMVALLSSTVVDASASVLVTNPTVETYYMGKSYASHDEWVSDAYMNIDSVLETDGLDVVIHADIHYDSTLIDNSDSGDLPTDNWQDVFINQAYGRLYAVVQFLRYDTMTDSTTYKQIVHDIVPDKIVLNDLYDTSSGYTVSTDLLYEAGLYFRNECGLSDTNFIIGTGKPQGVSVVENGREVIYKTKVVGVYGYLESPNDTSMYAYKIPMGDLIVCESYTDIQSIIGEQSRKSLSDFEDNIATATGQVMDAIGQSLGGLIDMLQGMIASVGAVPLMIGSLFPFFPMEVRAILGVTIAVAVLIVVIKIVT